MLRSYIRRNPSLTLMPEEMLNKIRARRSLRQINRAPAVAKTISEPRSKTKLKGGKFNMLQEQYFLFHCKEMVERFYGVTKNDLRRLAYEYASANKLDTNFDKLLKMAGFYWVEGFLRRHPELAVRKAGLTLGFDQFHVDRFYKNLKELYKKHKFRPNRIYNMDEIRLSAKLTAVCCMNVNGHDIPPALIHPRKIACDPSQIISMVSGTGLITTELFGNWLQHFKSFVHPTKADPVLLLIDNYTAHISLDALKYASDNNIVMLTLPPDEDHKFEPLYTCLYNPLKRQYLIERDTFMNKNAGKAICQYQVARLFNEAYKKVATPGYVELGFKFTGIYPFDDELVN